VTDTLRPADYDFLQDFLRDRIGHELGEGKEYLVQSRLEPLASRLGHRGLSPLFARLRQGAADLEQEVCAAMVTAETSFFRNPSVFERIRTAILPPLLSVRARERRLRIWSAGCATGQEPYSLAMTLLEEFPMLSGWDVRILATDLSAALLQQAEAGVFTTSQVRRGLSPTLVNSFFDSRDGVWQIKPEPRRLIQFSRHNLLDRPPGSDEFDLILVRNVLIYFSDSARAKVFATLRRMVREDGYLILGDSETILGQETDFRFGEDGMDFYRPNPVSSNIYDPYPY
jgi:chemotaxis protein methyltransferase CheR